ncbi:hypothetical protein SAMN05192560_1479 [Methylobacillus rhizosphaerae]|uniref:CopC domain-containing protein n=1 Tax=Methylobacillus rhizosphaerae TaxID=551994 RepID=A0A238ZRL7_9PROT|nr:copper resistance CopC family protein [Methylobacillus rhizosphaerae]SNR86057.1 hypothetical protein SAMN05192560_1479 [Methylobacillus rhizosphaerae]
MMKNLIAILLLLYTLPGWGHSKLVKTEPADGAILATPPQEVRVHFAKLIEPELHPAEIWHDGSWHKAHSTVRNRTLIIQLPENVSLTKYQLRWSVMSKDGHHQQGSMQFSVQ